MRRHAVSQVSGPWPNYLEKPNSKKRCQAPKNRVIALNPLISFVKRNSKSWRSETIQLGNMDIDI